jgi:hypothetical protein
MGHEEAGKALGAGMPEDAWATLRGFGRERLERKIRLKPYGFVKEESEKVERAYRNLLLGPTSYE